MAVAQVRQIKWRARTRKAAILSRRMHGTDGTDSEHIEERIIIVDSSFYGRVLCWRVVYRRDFYTQNPGYLSVVD